VELSAELLLAQPVPEVPRTGDNERLVDWAESCAIANQAANNQLTRIRKLQP